MPTASLQAECMGTLPPTDDGSACTAQLMSFEAQGKCSADAGGSGQGADSGAACQTATLACGNGLALTYCHATSAGGACVDPYYEVQGQVFPCASCADLSTCGDMARAYCTAVIDAGGE